MVYCIIFTFSYYPIVFHTIYKHLLYLQTSKSFIYINHYHCQFLGSTYNQEMDFLASTKYRKCLTLVFLKFIDSKILLK